MMTSPLAIVKAQVTIIGKLTLQVGFRPGIPVHKLFTILSLDKYLIM